MASKQAAALVALVADAGRTTSVDGSGNNWSQMGTSVGPTLLFSAARALKATNAVQQARDHNKSTLIYSASVRQGRRHHRNNNNNLHNDNNNNERSGSRSLDCPLNATLLLRLELLIQ